jgi:hypothetical protein
MDSTAHTANGASEIINENASTGDACIRHRKQPLWPQKSSTKLLPLVTHGFDSTNSPCGLRNLHRNCFHGGRMDSTAHIAPAASEICNETASTGDAWIRQRRQPLYPQKSSTKLLPLLTHGFDSANSPCGFSNHQETASTGDAWIRQRKEPLRAMKSSTKTESLQNQKSSTKLLPRVTHGFDSSKSPCGL